MSLSWFNFKLHGWMMWTAWSVLSLVQFASNRYLKGTLYGKNMWIHRMIGTTIMLITLVFGWAAYKYENYYIFDNWHSKFVFIILFGVPFIAIGGIISRSFLRRSVWNTTRALYIKKGHQIFGILFILVGQAAVTSGIYYYRQNHLIASQYELISVIIFFIIVLLAEFSFRKFLEKQTEFFLNPQLDTVPISIEEFERRVEVDKHKLVLLDDFVLDVSGFLDEHPGGRFSIQQNIGRDISKFFYGGYSLENIGWEKVQNHTHTNDARLIVNRLIIGRLEKKAICQQVKILKVTDLQADIKNFEFVPSNLQMNPEIKQSQDICPLIDYDQIAKHYVLMSSSHTKVRGGPSSLEEFDPTKQSWNRHYTECFSMRQDVTQLLLKLSETPDSDSVQKLQDALAKGNQQSTCLTIKNYKSGGLSQLVHKDSEVNESRVYQLKGPMGKGLEIQQTGEHVAFAAGTGILVFIDLVAYLIIQILVEKGGMKNLISEVERRIQFKKQKHIDLQNFKFVLYTAFPSENHLIGGQLINCLNSLCLKYGLNNLFSHIPRYSNLGNQTRWDENFFRNIFNEYENRTNQNSSLQDSGYLRQNTILAKRIWVCGPPIMQELFDRAIIIQNPIRVDEVYNQIKYIVL